MDMALASVDGLLFLLRWIHFMAGITWIGLLYYFNFVQVPFFAETDAPVRTGAIAKLVPRALWWFRWGAMVTFLSGITMILIEVARSGMGVLSLSWGIAIQMGALLGTLMFANVWLVIWPNQKIVIASTQAVATGGQADPRAAAAGARAFLASRTNTLFSIPMLFFMGAARHLSFFPNRAENPWLPVGLGLLMIAVLEFNALVSNKGEGLSKNLDSHVRVIYMGIGLAAIFYFLMELI